MSTPKQAPTPDPLPHAQHRRLRQLLSRFFVSPDEISILVGDAGLQPSAVNFSKKPEVIWEQVLEEACRRGKPVVKKLLKVCAEKAPVLLEDPTVQSVLKNDRGEFAFNGEAPPRFAERWVPVSLLLFVVLLFTAVFLGAWFDWGAPWCVERDARGDWRLTRGPAPAERWQVEDLRGAVIGLARVEGGFWRPAVRVNIPDPQRQGRERYRVRPLSFEAEPPRELAGAGEILESQAGQLRLNMGKQQGVAVGDVYYAAGMEPAAGGLAVVTALGAEEASLLRCGPWSRGQRALRYENPARLLKEIVRRAKEAIAREDFESARALSARLSCVPGGAAVRNAELSPAIEAGERAREERAMAEKRAEEGKKPKKMPRRTTTIYNSYASGNTAGDEAVQINVGLQIGGGGAHEVPERRP